MGRLRKLRIEATESANKALSEDKTGVKPAKTEESEQKTEDFGSIQDFYTLIESSRTNKETETEEEVITEKVEEKEEETVVTEEMKEVADKMKYILDYDITKTRKENLNK
mgnify:CR=1 FL=1